ncbi:hypothetical protein [Kouleothrix sp.]|uniref:hypothetical protein n=1 Tax=Kouleothrix sp. TaxID=2779161 RepID=UPI0039199776
MDDAVAGARVLVVVLTRQRDLAAARDEGWYRIPLARAPRAMQAEYLAFYQTAVFGDERWAVRYYAAVRAVSIRERAALLPDEPAHPRASQRYYCFALGPLERLAVPVPSRRLRRVCFIPTTFDLLVSAHDVAELWRPAETEEWEGIWGAGVNARL